MFSRLLIRLATLRGWRADAAAAALGAVSAAALPPVHLLPLLLIAVPGLLALLDGAQGPWGAARRGWWFGFGHHVLGLYWITEAILFEAARFWWLVPLAVPGLAAMLAPFIAVAAALAWRTPPGWPRALALAGAWTLADIARAYVLSGFPWNPWGSMWEFPGRLGDVFIQPAAWVGVHGLTFATLLLASVPTLGRRAWLGAAGAVLIWAAAGLVRLQSGGPPASGVTAVLVQGNVAQGQKWDRALALSIFGRYLALTEQGLARAQAGPGVVLWPETASPFLLQEDAAARQQIAAAADGRVVLAGSLRFDAAGRPRNSVIAIAPGGQVTGVYDKWHLVPFGEFEPAWFPLPIQVVPGGGFAPGPGPRTLHPPGLPPVGPMICYETVFSSEMVEPGDRPAWLFNATNDAWFGNSSGPRQHLAAARIRAVEEGLPLLRAANTGISAGFDAFGRELGRLGMNQTGTLVLPLPGALPPTLYARLGLWIPGLLALAALIAGFSLALKTGANRRTTPSNMRICSNP